MNELGTQWYAAGNLLLQTGFLIAGVWFAGRILRNMRVAQEQMGALLRLSLSGDCGEAEKLRTQAARQTPYLLDGWPAAMESPAPAAPSMRENMRRERPMAGAWSVAWSGLVGWLQSPMKNSEDGSWRRVVRWLQTPAA
jgi:hypothetical protein